MRGVATLKHVFNLIVPTDQEIKTKELVNVLST